MVGWLCTNQVSLLFTACAELNSIKFALARCYAQPSKLINAPWLCHDAPQFRGLCRKQSAAHDFTYMQLPASRSYQYGIGACGGVLPVLLRRLSRRLCSSLGGGSLYSTLSLLFFTLRGGSLGPPKRGSVIAISSSLGRRTCIRLK